MAKRMAKTLSFSSLFERDEHGHYTGDALLYQMILKYSIDFLNKGYPESYNLEQPTFTAWMITKWLVDNFTPFVEYYKDMDTRNTPKRNRIGSRIERIRNMLTDLVSLTLVQEVSENAKTSSFEDDKTTMTTTSRFKYTHSGYFLAWVIQSFNLSKREYASNKVYRILQLNSQDNPSTADIFSASLNKKCMDLHVFDDFVVNPLREALHSDTKNFQDYVKSPIKYYDKVEDLDLFSKLWFETLDELDTKARLLFLYQIKTDIEKKMEKQSRYPNEYEVHRFNSRSKYGVVALEAICMDCNFYSYIEFDVIEYIKQVIPYPHRQITDKCEGCKKSNSLIIPSLWFWQ
jgi:hypothetical protein